MDTTAETVRSWTVTTAVSQLQPSNDDSMDLQPPTWNESHIPYMGDLTPKPPWEIIIKVGYSVCC